MGDQRNKSVLLAVGKLTETLKQFAFMQGEFWAVQAHAQLFTQGSFLNKTLFQARDDFGVHAAVMIASHLGNAFTHPVG